MSLTIAESPDVLEDGAWTKRGHIVVWVPSKPPVALPGEFPIACPRCKARANEGCRTWAGRRTKSHGVRVLPRLCNCGAELGRYQQKCDGCMRTPRRTAA